MEGEIITYPLMILYRVIPKPKIYLQAWLTQ